MLHLLLSKRTCNTSNKSDSTHSFFQSIVFLGLLFFTAIAAAIEVTPYSPAHFYRNSGAPVVQEVHFATDNLNGSFVLTINNGGLENDEALGDFVSSSIIKLNGITVADPQLFNQGTSLITVPVTLSSNNQLSVELHGKPGGVITLTITGVVNVAPVANAGTNQRVFTGSSVTLDGSGSSDLDGDLLTYQWSLIGKPSTSQASLNQTNLFNPTFNADVEGDYVAQLIVNDGQLSSAPNQVLITALPESQPPVLSSIDNQIVEVGRDITLALTATDPNNDTISFSAQPLPLPGGATLDGETGEFKFKPTSDQAGSTISVTFIASDGVLIDTEAVSFTIPNVDTAATTRFTGRLLDANATEQGTTTPIVGATVSFLGTGQSAVSDNQGYFSLDNLPDGRQVLDIDPTNAQAGPNGVVYAGFREKFELLANVDNFNQRPFYLPQLDLSSLTTVNPAIETVVNNSALGVSLTIAAGSAKNSDGTLFTGEMSISVVPRGLAPAAMPKYLDPGLLVTIQPVGVTFNTPAAVTFPNIDAMAPGNEVDIWSVDPDLGQFVIVGTAKVSADGSVLETISGGIEAADWHALTGPLATGVDQGDKPNCGCGDKQEIGSNVDTRSGWLSKDFSLPSYQSLSKDRGLNFVYRSERAYSNPIIPFDVTIPLRSAVPPKISYEVYVGGVKQGNRSYISTAGLSEAEDETIRAGATFDASGFESGVYPYRIRVTNHYAQSNISTNIRGQVAVAGRGQESNWLGKGWEISGISKLSVTNKSTILLQNGNGQQSTYKKDAIGQVVYRNDFESTDNLSQWSRLVFSENAVFTRFLGRFWREPSETISLTLENLPEHTGVELLFDFYAIDSWDGKNPPNGPDKFRVGSGTQTSNLLNDFFQNHKYSRVSGSFGYNTRFSDSIYENLNGGYYFEHDESELTVNFTTQVNHNNINDESGGLDNVRVAIGRIEIVSDFESGSLEEFVSDGVNGGQANVVVEGQMFSDISDTTGIDLLGNYAVNVRSGSPDNSSSVGAITSQLLIAGDRLMFRERSESNNVGIEVRILDESNNVLLTQPVFPTLDTFRLHTINTSAFAGQQVKIQFRQNTLEEGRAWYTLIDEIKLFYGVTNSQVTEYESSDGDYSTLIKTSIGDYIRTLKNGTQIFFNDAGLQTKLTERNGNTTTYSYDSEQRLISITDPAGLVTTLNYGVEHLDTVTDPAGRVSRFEYDADGNLIKVTFPDGTFKTFGYDGRHLMTSEVDERSMISTHEFDFAGRVSHATRADGTTRDATNIKTYGLVDPATGTGTFTNPASYVRPAAAQSTFTDGNGNIFSSTTDGFGRLTRRTDANGLTTLIDRDKDGNAIKTTRPDGSVINRVFDEQGNLTSQTEGFNNATTQTIYEPTFSLVTSTTDALNNTTQYQRDAKGNITATINALGQTSTRSYNAAGLISQMVDANGLVTGYVYNTAGLPDSITQTPANGAGITRITQLIYDAAGQVIQSSSSPDGITLTMNYDANGRLIRVTDALGQTIEYSYDAAGNRTQTDSKAFDGALVSTLQQSYDAMDRLASLQQPHLTGQSIQQFEYDGADNPIGLIDANNNTSTQQYDPGNRLTQHIDALLGNTHYQYSSNGQLTQVIAPNGSQTDYQVDALGRITEEDSADRGTLSYSYDLNNNLTSLSDARGISRSYSYDALNRLTHISFPDSAENITLTYDNCTNGIGRLCQITDQSGTTALSYDGYGNIISKIDSRGGIDYTQTYQYNGSHQLTQMTLPSGRQVDYSRDSLQRISAIEATLDGSTQSIINNVQYTATGQVSQRIYGNGLTETRQYDLQSRLIQTDLTGLNQTLMSYDANGNLLSRQHDQTDNHYLYDELNRLYGDTQGSINNLIDYDANGNRVQFSTDSFTQTYGYSPQSNQLTDIDTQALNYDAAGNLTEDTQGRSYSYNNAGRLKEIQQSGQTLASYLYNSQGQRTQKTTGANTTVYHYDLTGQLISETHADGTPIKDYLWHNGNPIAQIDDVQGSTNVAGAGSAGATNTETISYLHTDQLQTARLATDQSQQIIWQWEGNAFGDTPPQELANIQINLRFPGQYYDQETNLHYNWNRYYNPATGRYIISDLVGLQGGKNTYLYALASPLRFTDSRGLDNVGCDGVPDRYETPCRLECCATHDQCFDINNCSAFSWIPGLGSPECNQCNKQVKEDLKQCGSNKGDDTNRPNFYCARQSRIVTIPGDFPSRKAAELVCGT